MLQLQIQVFANVDAKRDDKRIFERILELPDGVDIPFSRLLSDMKFLFGSSVVVCFNVL